MIGKAGRVFIRARDGSQYRLMISTVFNFARDYLQTYPNEVISSFNVLIDFLRQARTVMFVQQKFAEHVEIDTGLMYCYVKLDKFEELESFLQMVSASNQSVPNKGDIMQIGDRAFAERKFMAAKMLFSKIQCWGKLAICMLRLADYSNAVDAARRADDIPTWK